MAGIRAPPRATMDAITGTYSLVPSPLIDIHRNSTTMKVNLCEGKIERRGSEVLSFQSAVFDFSC
jgi:hypothetical protein